MKIAQVVHNFTGDRRGGTERWAGMLSADLAARHDVEVFTTAESEGPVRVGRTEAGGLPVTVVHRPRVEAATARRRVQAEVTRAYARFLAEGRHDLVHVHHVMDASVEMLGATADARVPWLLQLHDWWYACPRIDLIRKDLSVCETGPRMGFACMRHCAPAGDPREYAVAPEARGARSPRDVLFVYRYARNRRQLARVPRFVAGSNFLRDRWARLGLDPARVEVIPLGLPPAERLPRRAAERPIRFASLGRLSLMKGTDLLLEAFRGIGPDRATLTLHGSIPDPQRRLFEPLLDAAPANVRHAGPYDLDEALSRTDVVVVPSRMLETFSITTHEAFQRGVPVVAARRGALAEYVRHEVDGLLFEGAGELRACLDRLIDEPALADRLSANAPPVPTVAEQAARVESLYGRLRGEPARR